MILLSSPAGLGFFVVYFLCTVVTRSVLGVDAGTQREEAAEQVQQANTALISAREAADYEARTAKATGRVLDEV